jgi:hypothetical protein
MTVLGVPDIVVLEMIDIDLQAVIIDVDVDHKNVYSTIGYTAVLTTGKETAESYSGPQSPPVLYTNLQIF